MKSEQPLSSHDGAPQTEDGYTRIANELLEAILSFNFSSRQLNVLLAIIRSTYGYNKKSDAVSGWQLSKMTNIDRSSISKTIAELVKLNAIIKHEDGRESHGAFVNELSINKHYKTWVTVDKTSTVDKTHTVDKTSTLPLIKHPHTVDKTSIRPLIKHPSHKDITKDIPKDNTKDIDKKINIDFFTSINPQIVADYLAVRKAKKAPPINQTVFNGLQREALKAGYTIEQALKTCCERNWVGFNADWIGSKFNNPSTGAYKTQYQAQREKDKDAFVGESKVELNVIGVNYE